MTRKEWILQARTNPTLYRAVRREAWIEKISVSEFIRRAVTRRVRTNIDKEVERDP